MIRSLHDDIQGMQSQLESPFQQENKVKIRLAINDTLYLKNLHDNIQGMHSQLE